MRNKKGMWKIFINVKIVLVNWLKICAGSAEPFITGQQKVFTEKKGFQAQFTRSKILFHQFQMLKTSQYIKYRKNKSKYVANVKILKTQKTFVKWIENCFKIKELFYVVLPYQKNQKKMMKILLLTIW